MRKTQQKDLPLDLPALFAGENAGEYRVAGIVTEEDILKTARLIVERRLQRGPAMSDPYAVREYLGNALAGFDREVFCCLFLDNQNRILAFEKLFFGTINGTAVYPREVLKRALHHGAAGVIFAHNHPSGLATPSAADEILTTRLKEALAHVDVRVLDHIVVGGTDTVSFVERGLL